MNIDNNQSVHLLLVKDLNIWKCIPIKAFVYVSCFVSYEWYWVNIFIPVVSITSQALTIKWLQTALFEKIIKVIGPNGQ